MVLCWVGPPLLPNHSWQDAMKRGPGFFGNGEGGIG